MDTMIKTLVELEEEPLTNDPDAVGELLEAWDAVVDASPVEGDFEGWYDGRGFVQTQQLPGRVFLFAMEAIVLLFLSHMIRKWGNRT